MSRYVTLIILFAFNSTVAASSELMFSEKVLLSNTYDPRHIEFIYKDGAKLSGVHIGVEIPIQWHMDDTRGSQWFDATYSRGDGLVLKHKSKPIKFRLVGKVINHPIERVLNACYGKVSGSSMGIEMCLHDYKKLINVEINRAEELLEQGGKDVKPIQELWEKLRKYQYSYIKKQYLELPGTKWGYKIMEDLIEVDLNHLNLLNGWTENFYSYQR
jgi:hypothetical protein